MSSFITLFNLDLFAMRYLTARGAVFALGASRLATPVLAATVSSNPPWPYSFQLFEEERLLYEAGTLSGFVSGCAGRDSSTFAAQWIRIVSSPLR